MTKHATLIIGISLLALIIVFLASQFLWIKYNGTPVARPTIPRGEQTLGRGPALRYIVMGDSTSISQGGKYSEGYAAQSAAHLAKTHRLTWQNVGVSGARAKDIATEQLPKAIAFKPDVVLIAVGANDVTHLTSPSDVITALSHTIAQLRETNPAISIALTGSPDMGSVPRFPQPTRAFAGKRTADLNRQIIALADAERVAFAPIALKTGPIFRKHPELFAQDHFHPTTAGYKLWTPLVITALDEAIAERP